MAMSAHGAGVPMSPEEERRQLRRAVIASTIGTSIEWYDFFLYSTVTGLIFAKQFFPKSDPYVGLLNAFLIYAVGFIARPIGAAIFGHYGDRIGRKAALIATLLLMGLATFAVGFVPGYAQIGIWGAIVLTVLRFIQGIGVGGEWGGSVLLSMEWARTTKRRGFIASWPQFGVPVGLFLANLAVLALSQISGDGFATWGWRVPFFLSILLVGVGLYIRLGILESPIFAKLLATNKIEKQPVLAVIRSNPKEILVSALIRLSEQTPFYIFTAFIFAYGVDHLGHPRSLLLGAILAASAVEFVAIPYFGALSDRIGRRRMYLIGSACMAIYGFIYFGLLDTRSGLLLFVAVIGGEILHAMVYGPQAALIAENFTGRLRYSGASLGYQLASVIAGGPAPLIAAWLFRQYGSGYAIAGYIFVCSAIAFAATLALKDYTGRDISAEYDATPAFRGVVSGAPGG